MNGKKWEGQDLGKLKMTMRKIKDEEEENQRGRTQKIRDEKGKSKIRKRKIKDEEEENPN